MEKQCSLDDYLEGRWDKFRTRLEECQAGCSVETVRKLRVSLRKLLTALNAVLQVADCRAGQKALTRLNKHRKALGALRDVQMQRERLESLHFRSAATNELLDWVEKKEEKQLRRLGPALQRIRTGALQKQTRKAALKAQRTLDKRQGAPEGIWRRLLVKALQQIRRRHQALDRQDLETIHDLRIAFKKFRYLKEASVPDADCSALKAFQDKMGEVQDWEVLLRTIHRYSNRKGAGAFRRLTPLRKRVLVQRNRAVSKFWQARDDVLQWTEEEVT